MTPRVDAAGLKKTKPWEYLLRFAVGGAITVGAGIVARCWGPRVAGLFLAFPAILPSSLTLVKQHDGRAQAVEDARGGRLGSIGLIAYAVVVFALAARLPALLVLALATATWLVVDVALWTVVYRAPARRADGARSVASDRTQT